jgi:hypothetical protein
MEKRTIIIVFLIATLAVFLFGCNNINQIKTNQANSGNNLENNAIIVTDDNNSNNLEVKNMTLTIQSDAFENNGMIPSKYTCKGSNVNPPLQILGIPKGAKSLALIVDDPDAPSGDWVHWVVFNINPKTTSINENSVPSGAILGRNDFSKILWGGPCPPSGTHRYFFKLYALDSMLLLARGATKSELLIAMDGHIIEKTELVGLFKK